VTAFFFVYSGHNHPYISCKIQQHPRIMGVLLGVSFKIEPEGFICLGVLVEN
jgi:hypothetical protein